MFMFDYFRLYNPLIKPILIKQCSSNLCLPPPNQTQQWSGQFCHSVTPAWYRVSYHPSTSHQRRFSGFLFSRIFLFTLFMISVWFALWVFFRDFLDLYFKVSLIYLIVPLRYFFIPFWEFSFTLFRLRMNSVWIILNCKKCP